MPATPPLDLDAWPRPLVVGPAGADIVVVELDDKPADTWRAALDHAAPPGTVRAVLGLAGQAFRDAAELGPMILGRTVVAPHSDLLGDVRHAVARGGLVGLSGGRGAQVLEAAGRLVAEGVDSGGLIVEVAVGGSRRAGDRAEREAIDVVGQSCAAGFRTGVVLTDRPDDDEEGVSGWEIGVLTAALLAGARLVRGVEVRRARRVREVVAAIEAGAPAS